MSHDQDHERVGGICATCARVGRHEALTEARDLAADHERDARECLARATSPDKYAMSQRLELARKLRTGIEGLANAPAPLPDPGPITAETNVVPIGRARRGAKRRK